METSLTALREKITALPAPEIGQSLPDSINGKLLGNELRSLILERKNPTESNIAIYLLVDGTTLVELDYRGAMNDFLISHDYSEIAFKYQRSVHHEGFFISKITR